MKASPKRNRGGGAPTPPPSSGPIADASARYTVAEAPRVILNRYPGKCWACGLTVAPGGGQLLPRDFRGGRGWRLLHSPGLGMSTLERLASGCPGPLTVQILAPGQRAPRRKVAA